MIGDRAQLKVNNFRSGVTICVCCHKKATPMRTMLSGAEQYPLPRRPVVRRLSIAEGYTDMPINKTIEPSSSVLEHIATKVKQLTDTVTWLISAAGACDINIPP